MVDYFKAVSCIIMFHVGRIGIIFLVSPATKEIRKCFSFWFAVWFRSQPLNKIENLSGLRNSWNLRYEMGFSVNQLLQMMQIWKNKGTKITYL